MERWSSRVQHHTSTKLTTHDVSERERRKGFISSSFIVQTKLPRAVFSTGVQILATRHLGFTRQCLNAYSGISSTFQRISGSKTGWIGYLPDTLASVPMGPPHPQAKQPIWYPINVESPFPPFSSPDKLSSLLSLPFILRGEKLPSVLCSRRKTFNCVGFMDSETLRRCLFLLQTDVSAE